MNVVDGSGSSDATDAHSTVPLQRRRLRFHQAGGQVARGREFTRHVLRDLLPGGRTGAADPRFTDDALLAVSELLSNAIQHAGGAVELVITRSRAALRFDVLDGSTRRPVLRGVEPSRPGGHGLRVVSRLASRWGTTDVSGGKSVWAEFDLVPTAAAVPG